MPYFETSDFILSCTLLSLGYQVEALDRLNPDRVRFCFEYKEELDKLINNFWTGKISIEPKLFYQCQKILKSRLNNQ